MNKLEVLNSQELMSINGGSDVWDFFTSNDLAYKTGEFIGYSIGVTVVSALTAVKMIME